MAQDNNDKLILQQQVGNLRDQQVDYIDYLSDHAGDVKGTNEYINGAGGYKARLEQVEKLIDSDPAAAKALLQELTPDMNQHVERTLNPELKKQGKKPVEPFATVEERILGDQVQDVLNEFDGSKMERIRSATELENQRMVDAITIAAFQHIGVDTTGGLNTAKKVKLEADQQKAFDAFFAHEFEAAEEFALMPPRALIDAYKRAENGDNDTARAAILERMLQLTEQAARGADGKWRDPANRELYNFIDITNAGSTAAGYIEMFDFLEKHKGELGEGADISAIGPARGLIQHYLDDFDARHNLTGIVKGDTKAQGKYDTQAASVRDMLSVMPLSDEAKRILDKVKIDTPDDALAVEAINDLLQVAKNELINEYAFADNKPTADELKKLLDDKIKEVVYRTAIATKLPEDPEAFQDPAYVGQYIASLPGNPIKLSPGAISVAKQFNVQETVNVIDRAGTLMGTHSAPVLHNLYSNVERFDESENQITRADRLDGNEFKAPSKLSWLAKIGQSALVSGGMAAAFVIGRNMFAPWGNIACVLAQGALVYANTKSHFNAWKLETGNPNAKFGDYLKDGKNLLHFGTSVAGIAASAVGIMPSGMPGESLNGLGIGMRAASLVGVGVNGIIGGFKKIGGALEEAENTGGNKTLAVLKSIGKSAIGAAVPIVSALGAAHLTQSIINSGFLGGLFDKNRVDVNKEGWKSEKEITNNDGRTEQGFERTYEDKTVQHADRILDGKGTYKMHSNVSMTDPYDLTQQDFSDPHRFYQARWISNEDMNGSLDKLRGSGLFGAAQGEGDIGGWKPGVGNENVMLKQLLTGEKLGNSTVIDGNTITAREIMNTLRDSGGTLSDQQLRAVNTMMYNTSTHGHIMSDVIRPDLAQFHGHDQVIGVNSFRTNLPNGIMTGTTEVNVPPTTSIQTNINLDKLPVALPFVFPVAKTAKKFKTGVKSLLDKIKFKPKKPEPENSDDMDEKPAPKPKPKPGKAMLEEKENPALKKKPGVLLEEKENPDEKKKKRPDVLLEQGVSR
ncbi:MAG: hypothetical protein FWD15_04895 [Alphaproteobacteria bacterium]|nr:hypothetical protein [Alphaproteobacteria bacterium]